VSNLENIKKEKMLIEQEQDEAAYKKENVKQTKETYEAFFIQQKQLFNELQENFAQSRVSLLYQEMAEQVHWQYLGIQDFLEEEQMLVEQQISVLKDKQEQLDWRQKHLFDGEQEENHEY